MIPGIQHHPRPSNPSDTPSTFLTFVYDARPLLYTFLHSRGVSSIDIDDIAQDCMERLIRYRRCRTDELYLLLHRIAKNRLADFRRSPRAQMESKLTSIDETLEDTSSSADPLRQAMVGQMLDLFYQALSTLSDCPREVYLLNRVAGMSYAQIARHRGITMKTVEKQISRALQDLRKTLDAIAIHVDEYS